MRLLATVAIYLATLTPAFAERVSTLYVDTINSPFERAETLQILQGVADTLKSEAGWQLTITEGFLPASFPAGACQLTWFSGLDLDPEVRAATFTSPVCAIGIRKGFLSLLDTHELRCIALHELGHASLIGTPHFYWHSSDTSSAMRLARPPGQPCAVTQDYVSLLGFGSEVSSDKPARPSAPSHHSASPGRSQVR